MNELKLACGHGGSDRNSDPEGDKDVNIFTGGEARIHPYVHLALTVNIFTGGEPRLHPHVPLALTSASLAIPAVGAAVHIVTHVSLLCCLCVHL